jgi:hypothetical protein
MEEPAASMFRVENGCKQHDITSQKTVIFMEREQM